MEIIEFDETFTERYVGTVAVARRVSYRLQPRKGEIPYFNGGIDINEFSYSSNFLGDIRYLLRDFQVSVNLIGDRVIVGDVAVTIPRDAT
jgi:hypothetical protein